MKCHMPKVSVIIPVYNVEKYLRACLDSIVNQTLKDVEIICVDDGSTDGSAVILAEYAAKDNRIKVVRTVNGGAGVARNVGLDLAHGEYAYFSDSDDILHRKLLELLYKAAIRQGAEIAICGFVRVSSDLHRVLGFVPVPDILLSRMKAAGGTVAGRDMGDVGFSARTTEYCWNRIVSIPFVREHGIRFQDLKRNNDLYFARITFALAQRITFVNRILYAYRKGDASAISSNGSNAHFFCDACEALRQRLKTEGLWELYCGDFARLMIQVFLSNIKTVSGSEAMTKWYRDVRLRILAMIGEEVNCGRWAARLRQAYRFLVEDETPQRILDMVRPQRNVRVGLGRLFRKRASGFAKRMWLSVLWRV